MDTEFTAKTEIFTAAKDLATKIKNLKANHKKAFDDLNSEIKDDIDLDLCDGVNILTALIEFSQNP